MISSIGNSRFMSIWEGKVGVIVCVTVHSMSGFLKLSSQCVQ